MELVTKRDMEDAKGLGESSGLNMMDDWDEFIHDVAQTIAEGRRPTEDGIVPDRESAWLVERKCTPPQYVSDRSELPGFTQDPWRAVRFDTERAAFDFRLRMATMRDECLETEHVFINKRE